MLNGAQIKSLMSSETAPADRLVVTPLFEASAIDDDAASIDLRLGCRFAIAKRRRLPVMKANAEEVHPRRLVDEYFIPLGEKFILHPLGFALGVTLEWIRLPP